MVCVIILFRLLLFVLSEFFFIYNSDWPGWNTIGILFWG